MAVTQQTNTTLEEIAKAISERDDFVICGHVGPDGDCLGSQLCLAHALRQMGKRVTCVMAADDVVSASISNLPGFEEIIPARSFTGTCEVFIGVDVPIRERIGDAAAILDKASLSVTVDHHASDTTMCDLVYVDPDSASASIIVWELVKLLVDKPPLESALCAYTGLITDTGGFRFQNSDAVAFSAASELVAYGVDPAAVATQVFQNRSLPSLKLEALAIDRMQLLEQGQAAISWIGKSDLDEHSATKADAEPLIDALRSLAGVRVACILREQGCDVRGSLRSKGDTDVSRLARELGGGGHKAAAGFTVHQPMEEAVKLLSEKIIDLLHSEGEEHSS